jgi:hypothetical protein
VEVNVATICRIAHENEVFDVIDKAHRNTGHGAARITHKNLKQFFPNISRKVCDRFYRLCVCSVSKKMPTRPEGIKPILSFNFNDRGQVINKLIFLYLYV